MRKLQIQDNSQFPVKMAAKPVAEGSSPKGPQIFKLVEQKVVQSTSSAGAAPPHIYKLVGQPVVENLPMTTALPNQTPSPALQQNDRASNFAAYVANVLRSVDETKQLELEMSIMVAIGQILQK